MRFEFSDEQYALRDAARHFFAGECDPAHLRAMWASESGRSPRLWKQMADMGFIGLTVPSEHGGLGLTEIDLALLLEEVGYAGTPEPVLETTGVAVPFLLEAASPAQQAEWLPRVAAGDAVVTVQLAGEPLVSDAHIADLLLVEHEGELHAVPAALLKATPQPSIDGARRLFTVDAELSPATRMHGGAAEAAKAFDRAAAGTAALLCGVGQRLLDMTVAYVKERHQFGRPVGSFQAVKHKLAETYLAVETAKPASWYAAYAIAHDLPDRAEAASVAKSYASDAAAKASQEALQCHGGIGFTWEHDLHLWLKRAAALQRSHGSGRWHRARLAETVLV